MELFRVQAISAGKEINSIDYGAMIGGACLLVLTVLQLRAPAPRGPIRFSFTDPCALRALQAR